MYGPKDHFESERSHAFTALIKRMYDAKVKNIKKFCNAPLKAREKIDKKSREKLCNIFIII